MFTTSKIYPKNDRRDFHLYVSDIRYHQELALLQPINVKLEISPPVDDAVGLKRVEYNSTFKDEYTSLKMNVNIFLNLDFCLSWKD